MGRNNPKEGVSISISSSTVEGAKLFCEIMEITNFSDFCNSALRNEVGRRLADNPLSWDQVLTVLRGMSS
jgi:hypothetical protein